ncbi:tetratricopeptide repeat protein 17-like [Diadema setosum]|uniref:tetratricopeptide repeat protein 17-like n=1 Tax=Diadema setosum TaxID=31175 RepID=UPI003B3B44EE
MAASLRVGQLLVVFWLAFSSCQATTHWVVTEDGMITQQLDSVFNMKEPYNLIAILNQEKRSKEVSNLEEDLRVQKADIEANEDKDTDLEQRFLETDEDCVAAGRPLSEFELYISTALSLEQKGINPMDYLKTKNGEVKKFRQPNCSRAYELPFSIFAYDHIKSIQERHNISSFPEPELMYLLPTIGSLENGGHMIYKAMTKNKTSWVLFNLAAYYWRVKGHPEQVIECSRRALHFSPPIHKNVALMNIANVLHRGHLSNDAAILAQAALEVEDDIDIVYFTLGNIYAAIGEYNRSSECFGHTARINPALGAAEKRQHAVKCHQKLEGALEAQHSSLQRTLAELKDYQTKQEYFLELQKKMWSQQRKAEEQFEANLSYQKHRFLQEMGENPKCEVSHLGSGTQFLMCRRDGIPESDIYGLPIDEEKEIEVVDESLLQDNCVVFPNGEKNCLNLSLEGTQEEMEYARPVDPVSVTPLSGRMDQPNNDACSKWTSSNTSWKEYTQQLLPLSNRASLEVLKTNIDFSGSVMDLEVPTCSSMFPLLEGATQVDFVEAITKKAALPTSDPPQSLRQMFEEFLAQHKMSEEEFGFRVAIGVAARQEIKDRWLVFNGASIYWRLHGDNFNAIECLRRALFHAPADQIDLPLTNMALILYDLDLPEDATQILRMGLPISNLKPPARFLLACGYAWVGKYRQALQEVSLAHTLDKELLGAKDVLDIVECFLKETGGQDRYKVPEDGMTPEAKTAHRKMEFERHTVFIQDGRQVTREEAQQALLERGPLHDLTFTTVTTEKSAPAVKKGSEVLPACVQGPPLDGPAQTGTADGTTGNPGVQRNPASNGDTFKSCKAGSVPSTAFGPQIPAVPAPDVDVHKLLSQTQLVWPTVEECGTFRRLNLKAFYSTWVSVSAKDLRLEEYMDFTTTLTREELEIQPYCKPDEPISMHTLDHIPAMAQRRDLNYEAEQGLKEVMQTIHGGHMSVDEVGARVAIALKKDPESWVATNMAALYWRIEGKSENALDCLRHALHYAPSSMKDLALVSIANIFHRVGMHDDAVTVARMAIDISPQLVINHFTLANIYSSKGQWDLALEFYQSTLNLQPDFQPAVERLRTIQCNVLQLTGGGSQSP